MNDLRLARGLGWFSIGLGLTQIVAPGWLGRAIGVGERNGLMRALGAREIITGLAVLAERPSPALPIWGRVAGDAMDMALLAAALKNPYNDRARIAGAAGMVLGVGLLDWACAQSLERYH